MWEVVYRKRQAAAWQSQLVCRVISHVLLCTFPCGVIIIPFLFRSFSHRICSIQYLSFWHVACRISMNNVCSIKKQKEENYRMTDQWPRSYIYLFQDLVRHFSSVQIGRFILLNHCFSLHSSISDWRKRKTHLL